VAFRGSRKNGRDIPNGVRYDLNRNILFISSDRDRDRESTFPPDPSLPILRPRGIFCHLSLLPP
jgi:hypothetical protein